MPSVTIPQRRVRAVEMRSLLKAFGSTLMTWNRSRTGPSDPMHRIGDARTATDDRSAEKSLDPDPDGWGGET